VKKILKVDFTSEFNSMDANADYTKPDVTVELDDEAIKDNVIYDPTMLTKKYSYKDCTLGTIPKEVKSELWKMLKCHKDAFATSKLDVGKFKGLAIQLQIEEDIPIEKQRYMSPEKIEFCRKNFQVF